MEVIRSIHLNKSGIYSFRNKTNDKRYIGQAKSIYKRYIDHFSGKSCAPKFVGAISKYGLDNFEFSILEECAIESLDDREEYWILFYNTIDDEFGYNIVQRQDRKRGPHSDATRQKIKDSLKIAFPNGTSGKNNQFYGKKHSKETLELLSSKLKGRVSNNKRAVIAFKENEEREFESIALASKSVDGCREVIWKAIKTNTTYKGYLWRYKVEKEK